MEVLTTIHGGFRWLITLVALIAIVKWRSSLDSSQIFSQQPDRYPDFSDFDFDGRQPLSQRLAILVIGN